MAASSSSWPAGSTTSWAPRAPASWCRRWSSGWPTPWCTPCPGRPGPSWPGCSPRPPRWPAPRRSTGPGTTGPGGASTRPARPRWRPSGRRPAPVAVAGQAAVLVDVGEPAAAVQLLEQARRRPDGPAQARLRRGAGHGRGGRRRAAGSRQAIAAAERAAAPRRPDLIDRVRPAGRWSWPTCTAGTGRVLVTLGDPGRAEPLRRALAAGPRSARHRAAVHADLALALHAERRQEAAAHARTARQLATGIGSDAHRGPPGRARRRHAAPTAALRGAARPGVEPRGGQLVGRPVRVQLAGQHPLGQLGQAAGAPDLVEPGPNPLQGDRLDLRAGPGQPAPLPLPDASSQRDGRRGRPTSSSIPSPRAATVRCTGIRQPAARSGLGPCVRAQRQHLPQVAHRLRRRRRGRPCSPRTRRRPRGCRPWPPGPRRPCPGPAAPPWCRPARRPRSRSGRPRPSREHHVAAGRVEHPQRVRGRPGQPAEVAAGGHRADEHALVGGVLAHPDPVAEQRAAGERRRRVDGEHADPAALRAQRPTSADVVVDLPTPGGPVSPTTCAARRTARAPRPPRAARGPPSSTSEISRATASCSPRRARATRSATSGRRTASDGGQPAAGTRMIRASPWPPPPHSAAAPTPPPRRSQLQRQVQRDPGAGHADRVAERDRAAVDVDLVRVDAELAGGHDADGGERLVDLDEVEVGAARCPPWRSAAAIALAGCSCRLASGPATTPCAPISASQVRPSSSALALLITTTAAAPSEICEAEPAVMVPSVENAGRSLPRDSAVVSPRMPSSVLNYDRVALALRDRRPARSPRRTRRSPRPRRPAGASGRRTRPARRGSARSGALYFSVDAPIATWSNAQNRPSWAMWSSMRHVAVLEALAATCRAGAAPGSSTPGRRPRRCRTRRPG